VVGLDEAHAGGSASVGGDAGLSDGVAVGLEGKPSTHRCLAGNVRSENFLDHGAHQAVVDLLPGDLGLGHETFDGLAQQVVRHQVLKLGASDAKGRAGTIDEDNLLEVGIYGLDGHGSGASGRGSAGQSRAHV
jgi:hypothetical protein